MCPYKKKRYNLPPLKKQKQPKKNHQRDGVSPFSTEVQGISEPINKMSFVDTLSSQKKAFQTKSTSELEKEVLRGGLFRSFVWVNLCEISEASNWFEEVHPQKLTWNLEMMVSNRNLLFQGSIFRFHVCFGGCIPKNLLHWGLRFQLWSHGAPYKWPKIFHG